MDLGDLLLFVTPLLLAIAYGIGWVMKEFW